MERFKAGDIVRVRNARDKIGIYQIASDHDWYYKVYVLKFLKLPLVGSDMFPELEMHPKLFMKRAETDPTLYQRVQFERKHLTTKASHNITEKLPIDPSQVLY